MKSRLKPTILILGSEDDLNLINLIEWLNFHRANLFFMNTSIMEIEIIHYGFDEKKLTIEVNDGVNLYEVDFTDLKVTFSRGNRIRFKKMNNPLAKDHDNGWLSYNLVYQDNLDTFIEYYLRGNSIFIGSWQSGLVNKLIVLEEAQKVGLKIPNSFLLTGVERLDKSKCYVSKSFGLPYRGMIDSSFITSYTEKIPQEKVPKKFMSSFVQEEIKKKFEVRTFIFMDMVFSMAIFSQMNSKSLTDYRHYDFDNPYLNEPFELPKDILLKTKKLMEKLNINTGSIDFIYSTDSEFYFLEINPNGQFGNVGSVNGVDLFEVLSKKIMEYV